MARLINSGSIDDIRNELKIREPNMSLEELENEYDDEISKGQNARLTVVSMLEAAIKRKLKSK